MRLRISPVLATVMVMIGVSMVCWTIDNAERARAEQELRAALVEQLGGLRARLEGEIGTATQLARGMVADIALHPTLDNAEFGLFARELLAREPARLRGLIRHLSLARANRISHLYPLTGNEALWGLDLMAQPAERDGVVLAIQTRQTVLTGPLPLPGGQGAALISRTPVFLTPVGGEPGAGEYWGVASVVMKADVVFAVTGLRAATERLDVGLRDGETGEMVFGNPDVFSSDPVVVDIMPAGRHWELAAIPLGGWAGPLSPERWVLRFVSAMVAAVVGLLVYMILYDQRRIRHLALHDNLTGLPNRVLLHDRMNQAISRAARNNIHVGVMHLDLDDFKPVNDTHGHEIGDMVLAEAARRLVAALRDSDTVARIGGDEFVVMLPDLLRGGDAAGAARKLIAAFAAPLVVKGIACPIGVSIGVALYPRDGETTEALIRSADTAMYLAKDAGKNTIFCCTDGEDAHCPVPPESE